jgi:superfamily II DNA or RNA helicase
MHKYLKKLNTFSDIYTITKDMEKNDKGDLFELLTYYMFKLDPKLNNIQKIWLYKDVPDKVLKYLNLPSTDKGIDLIMAINDEYYAIQCKFRQNPDTMIPWKGLSTFFGLSFGMNNKIKKGFLVTNTYDLCDEVLKSNKAEAIYGDYFDELPNIFFKNLRSVLTEDKIVTYEGKKHYAHQTLCKIECDEHFQDHDKCYIEMACGVGKTLTSYWIDQSLVNNTTIIFIPSLQLLSQFYSDWINQSYAERVKINYLLIGSDVSVDDEVKYKSNGLLLYTDVDSIRKYVKMFLKPNDKYITNKLVIICTYHSSKRLIEACSDTEFDFAIYDEAHKTVGQTDGMFSSVVTNNKLKVKKKLFMTATPKVYKGSLEDDDIISMDDEEHYGKRVYTYNTGNAINDWKLTDYRIISMYTTDKDIADDLKEHKLIKYKDEFEDMDANYLGIILILLKKIHDGTCNHMITYHNTVKNARKFSEVMSQINGNVHNKEVFIEYLDGTMSMTKRRKIITEYVNSKKGILCSAKVLNEGINIPIVDSVCFVDTRFSTIDIVQCIGRALRLHPKKKLAYVFVPTFIKDLEDDFDKDQYADVIRILKSMKNTDDGIVEYFKIRSNEGSIVRNIYSSEYYNTVNKSKEIDIKKWSDKIVTKIWDIVDPFMTKYNDLKRWVDEHDRMPLKRSSDVVERKLGQWCISIRKLHRKNKLSVCHTQLMNNIKSWVWECKFDFDTTYNELKTFMKTYERLPYTSSKDDKERKLGNWCCSTRKLYRKNELSQRQIDLMSSIEGWFWTNHISFQDTYDELRTWISKTKSTPAPTGKTEKEQLLWKRCNGIRIKYKENKLTDKQVRLMENTAGWRWDSKNTFLNNYNELRTWIQQNDYLPSLGSKNATEHKLAQWCATQRQNKKKNKLSQDRIKCLESLKYWRWQNEDLFLNNFNMLKAWYKKYDNMPSLKGDTEYEQKLSRWCTTQRQNKKKNKLVTERVRMLSSLSYWSWGNDELFLNTFNELKKWMRCHRQLPSLGGDTKIEKKLAQWCLSQRQNKKNNKLSPERTTMLSSLDKWEWNLK